MAGDKRFCTHFRICADSPRHLRDHMNNVDFILDPIKALFDALYAHGQVQRDPVVEPPGAMGSELCEELQRRLVLLSEEAKQVQAGKAYSAD